MIPPVSFRKIFQGVATRRQMFHLFDRHAQAPMSKARYTGRLYDGEWFEIGRAEYDYMFEVLPPLWMQGEMFAMREFMAGSITSVFFALGMNGRIRYFHGYCDMLASGSAERLRDIILARTPADYRGYAGEGWLEQHRDKPTILINGGARGAVLTLLEDLSAQHMQRLAPLAEPVVA